MLKKLLTYLYKNLLPLGFGAIITMMLATAIVSITLINNASNKMFNAAQVHQNNQDLLNIMSTTVFNRSLKLFEILQTNDAFENDDTYLQLNILATDFVVARAKFEKNELDKISKKLLKKQGELSRINAPKQLMVYELVQQGKRGDAVKYFKSTTLPSRKEISNIITELSKHQSELSKEAFLMAKKNKVIIISYIALVSLITIILAISLTVYVTNRQRQSVIKLESQAITDSLTGLPNRKHFIYKINTQIIEKPNTTFAVVFFDIDYFKSINDNYGHDIGDETLKKFSSIIKSRIKPTDTLARFGGDEFVLLLTHITSKTQAFDFIQQLSQALETSINIDDHEIFITSSIGASLYPNDAKTTKSLLKNADIAMYSAKQDGRNCFKCFSRKVSKTMDKEHLITHALHTVLKDENSDNQLYLKYQPLYNIKNQDITEFEALIRWRNSDGSHIPPDEFIPLAEKSNLIEKINLFVINEACKQQHLWQKTEMNNIRININLSGNKIIFRKLLEQFNKNIKEMNLSPSMFGIELTERTLNQISDETINELDEIRIRGMKISIDDFGTDYSSLIYLKKLPITTLKIDKAFICDLKEGSEDEALVKTIIELGHSLNLDVVAEGVETPEQLHLLKKHACNIAQGYFFNKPLDSDQAYKSKKVA